MLESTVIAVSLSLSLSLHQPAMLPTTLPQQSLSLHTNGISIAIPPARAFIPRQPQRSRTHPFATPPRLHRRRPIRPHLSFGVSIPPFSQCNEQRCMLWKRIQLRHVSRFLETSERGNRCSEKVSVSESAFLLSVDAMSRGACFGSGYC